MMGIVVFGISVLVLFLVIVFGVVYVVMNLGVFVVIMIVGCNLDDFKGFGCV